MQVTNESEEFGEYDFSHHLQLGSDMKPEEIKITPDMEHSVEEKNYFF